MPVSDLPRLQALAQQLAAAGADQDWERLAQLDRLTQQWAQQPPAALPDDAAVQAAWRQIVQAHGQARAACRLALAEAGARLRDLPHQNEAHKAYAWQEQFS